MELRFRNDYGTRLWVCILFHDPGRCGQYGNWGTRGWWVIEPGNEAYVLDTDNRNAYFYAEAADGGVWAGPYGPVLAPRRAFDSCLDISNNVDPSVHCRHVRLATSRHTVNLTRSA